jgi:hypothetical protein
MDSEGSSIECARNEWDLFDSRLRGQVNEPGVNRVHDPLVSHRVSSTEAIQQTGISGNECRPRAVVLDKAGATVYDPGTKVLMEEPSGLGKGGSKCCRQNRISLRQNPSGGQAPPDDVGSPTTARTCAPRA